MKKFPSIKRFFPYLSLIAYCLLLIPAKALAFCPVCTVAVAAGVGLSRWIGIDDTISGIWVGAFTVSAIAWTVIWLKSRNWKFPGMEVVVALVYYATVLIPFYKTDIISNHPKNMLWGVDKILLGMVIGSFAFLLFYYAYLIVKEKNGGKAHFPFEKIVFVIVPLLILSGIFYFITKH
jgi:hypothetical protein